MEMISLKSPREIERMRRAGRITAQARALAGTLVRPGVTTLEIDTAHITATSVPNELSRQMRASYYFLGALLGVPQGMGLFELLGSGGALKSIVYGVLWGVGGLTFGLSMRYLGVALGQSISLGTCAGFGTLLPAIFAGTNLFRGEGLILLVGVCITLAGIAVIGYAGSLRSKNMTEEE